jgi:outer membrane protein assembly factor BamB
MSNRFIGLLLLAVPLAAADIDGWAKWRGPKDDGMARGDAPLEWSDTKNIAWKLKIPGKGHSSPIVYGDKIFLTSAIAVETPAPAAPAEAPGGSGPGGGGRRGGMTPGGAKGVTHKFMVYCIDKRTGKMIWEREAAAMAPHEGYHNRYGSYASNTPATDGKSLYAFFGSFGLYAFDLDGKPLWKKPFPAQRMRMEFGEGVPLTLHEDRLMVKLDSEQDSFMVVLDKATGKELWRVTREERSSWSPPLVVTVAGKKQIVTSATTRTRGYDWDTGKVVWECAGLGANVIPAPVLVDPTTIIVMSGFRDPNLQAIRLDKQGDLSGTDSILWQNQRGNSYTPSPVLYQGNLYFLTDNGQLSCFDAKTGKPHYHQQRLPKPYNFKASPVGANGKLYLASEEGDVIVVKLDPKYEVLATNTLENASFIATPAIVDGSIYLRSQDTLYAIRAGK